MRKFFTYLLLLFLIFSVVEGCAYFNAFYLAKKSYNDAEREREKANGVTNVNAKNNYSNAIKNAKEVLDKYGNSRYADDSMYIIGMSYYYQNEFVLARSQFDELIKLYPNSKFILEAQYFKARSLIGLSQYENARIILNDLVKTNDRSMKGRAGLTLAEITYAGEEWNELLTGAQSVIDSDPEKAELARSILYKGEALYQLGRYEDSISTLETLSRFKLEPELRFKANSFIAQSKAKLGDFEQALVYLRNMEDRGEFNSFAPRIRFEIGKIYETQGEKELAIDTYKKMAGDFPDSLSARNAWYRVGMILLDDLANAKEAKDAFNLVVKGNVRTKESWLVDATIKSTQIDSMYARLDRIDKLTDDIENLARTRFALAELYTFSFERADSALTQYRRIMEEAPGTEYAIMSDFFVRRETLIESGKYSEESEREMINDLISLYPNSEFIGKLRAYIGLENDTPHVLALKKAEESRMNGQPWETYIPLYQEVVDSFPDTRSAYLARFVLAYSYEHDAGEKDKAMELYRSLAVEKPTFVNSEFVEKAREKLEFYEDEPKMVEDIKKYLAGYESRKNNNLSYETNEQAVIELQVDENGYSGTRKIRERNARIRSRYFTD